MIKLIQLLFAILLAILILPVQAQASQVFQSGKASYYGKAHHGKRTASGVRFNMHGLTAAHRTLPFGTKLRVTSKDTGKSVIVTVNDRGPYHGNRILDLSQEAARQLNLIKLGVGHVTIERIGNIEKTIDRIKESPRPKTPELPKLPIEIQHQLDPVEELITRLNL